MMPLSVAVGLASAMSGAGLVEAKDLIGQDETVSTPVSDNYNLTRGANLLVTATGSTLGIIAASGSTVTVNGGQVTANGGATGIAMREGTRASLDGATVTGGTSGYGVSAINASTIVARDSTMIGGSGTALSHGSVLELIGSTLTGTRQMGAFLNGSTLIASGGSVISGKNNGLNVTQELASGGGGGSQVRLDGSTVMSETASAILVRAATDGTIGTATIEVNNGSELIGGNGTILEVTGGMTADFTADNSQLSGDVVVEAGSTANLLLQNNASLRGNLVNVQSLDLDSGSRWILTQDGEVGELTLDNGTVDFTDRDTTAGFKTLTVESLKGSGIFVMDIDLASGTGDLLKVTGAAEGSHQLSIASTGADPVEGQAPHRIVETGGGDATFGLLHDIDFGTYTYTLEKGEGEDNWYLVQKFDDSGNPIVTPGARAVLGMFSAAPTVWYGELSSLRSRMGELRLGHGQGIWMRSYGNRYNLSAGNAVAYQQDQNGVSFGADGAVPGHDGRWLLGVMGGYSESDLDFSLGSSGKVKSYYVGAYSTWMADSGYYVDAVLKYNRFRNSNDVVMSDGRRTKGEYHNDGLGASVEVGRHFKLENGWYVEPFTQVSTLWVDDDSYTLDNGMRAQSDGANSVLGKVGAQVGRSLALDNGSILQPYLKVAAAHEFIKSNKVKVNDNHFTNDLSGTRGEFAVGLAAQVSEVLQLHGEFQYSNGKHIEQPYGVNLGLRYNF
ncbi:autotransporter outer membrane beta-barrel domain-containing protein [Pseudomonas mosselii]|uniref:Autotransporter outer membrane beta-barrel domain-containing protein n=1 Tax=Pseudomonas mosselii TaxID=78327 RepID=A0AA42UNN6_9PSED|nr:autotransporter outer membrane beta-barrel domain-containing protein [Pseudomonas mosselii]MDH1632967.1 autotransporter outer membrane beta-barrel domain-containing protein [Pseudomonas mosselii]